MAAAKLRDIIQPNIKGDIFLVPIESDQSAYMMLSNKKNITMGNWVAQDSNQNQMTRKRRGCRLQMGLQTIKRMCVHIKLGHWVQLFIYEL